MTTPCHEYVPPSNVTIPQLNYETRHYPGHYRVNIPDLFSGHAASRGIKFCPTCGASVEDAQMQEAAGSWPEAAIHKAEQTYPGITFEVDLCPGPVFVDVFARRNGKAGKATLSGGRIAANLSTFPGDLIQETFAEAVAALQAAEAAVQL